MTASELYGWLVTSCHRPPARGSLAAAAAAALYAFELTVSAGAVRRNENCYINRVIATEYLNRHWRPCLALANFNLSLCFQSCDEVLGGDVPTVDHLAKLSYTRMVLEEVLRLYPPAWIFGRKAIANDEIGGYFIPANSIIVLSPYITHRHPAFWEHAEVFNPERFAPEQAAGRPHFAYFPFGGGPRICIGNNFALMEIQLVLATIAQHYRLRLVPGHPVEPEALLSLRPRSGLPMTLQRRSI